MDIMNLIDTALSDAAQSGLDSVTQKRDEIERRLSTVRQLLTDNLGADCLPVRVMDGRA